MDNSSRIEIITQRLQALAPTQLEVIDESAAHVGHAGAQSGAGHFAVIIAAPTLRDKTRVQAHQLVYAELADLIPNEIHALRIQIVKEQHD